MKLTKRNLWAIFIGLFCSALHAAEIDLKLTTSDGSTQVSVDNAASASVAAIDSAGNVTFGAALQPNGLPGTAGQVLQSNGPSASPTWVPPTPLPATLLAATSTWTAPQTYSQTVTVSTNLVVNSGGVISGNGSGLTNLVPGSITAGVYGGITGLGAQSQNLNLNSNLINNLGAPAVGTDAATKAYVDALFTSPNSWTAPQTYTQTVTVSTNLVVNSGGVVSGDGSGLINLTPASVSAGILPNNVVASSIAAGTVYPDAVAAGVYGTVTGVGVQGQNLNMNSNLINNLGTPAAGADAATKAYVDAATTAVIAAHLLSTSTWTAQQTFTKQIAVSTSIALSGSLIAGGSAGTSGQLLQSQGNASAPAWISSTTLLGGIPILKQGAASLSFVSKNVSYAMTTADFAILGDASVGVVNITLPPASNAGMLVFIIKKDSSANNVNIVGGAGDTIQGSTPVSLGGQYQKRLLIADGGTTWYVMSQ